VRTWRHTSEKKLGRGESASRQDDTTGARRDRHDARLASAVALELDTGGVTAVADDTLGSRVHPESELLPLDSGNQVGGQGAATLAIRVHESAVAVRVVLHVGMIVGDDVLPARLVQSTSDQVIALLVVQLVVHRRSPGL